NGIPRRSSGYQRVRDNCCPNCAVCFIKKGPLMKYKTFILFGAPGSGKGTQGKTLGSIPRFFHCPCGDVFRSIDTRTEVAKLFLNIPAKASSYPTKSRSSLGKKRSNAPS